MVRIHINPPIHKSSVLKKIDFGVNGENQGLKLRKTKELAIRILTEAEFKK